MADTNPKSKEFWMSLIALIGVVAKGIIDIVFG